MQGTAAGESVYYKVERTYLTNLEGESEQQHDKTPYFVSASDSSAAATSFVSGENARLLGGVSAFAGDKATATAWCDGRLYIIFVQRGVEAIAGANDVKDEVRR